MNVVKLWGGLGNQFFQYAFGQYLVNATGDPVVFVNKNGTCDLSGLKISHFNCQLSLPNESLTHGYESYFEKQHRFKRKLHQLFPWTNNRITVEAAYPHQPVLFKKNQLYDGYWQNLSYLNYQESRIQKAFQFKENSPYLNSPYLNLVQSAENAVCMHIRRGDYLQSTYHHQLNMAYYLQAIEEINRTVSKPQFFVFSNDLEWVKDHLKANEMMHYVHHQSQTNTDLFDFFLMQQCQHHIIANSSFSWWPAYLNQDPKKIVIAPKNWYKGKYNDLYLNIVPGSWITL